MKNNLQIRHNVADLKIFFFEICVSTHHFRMAKGYEVQVLYFLPVSLGFGYRIFLDSSVSDNFPCK